MGVTVTANRHGCWRAHRGGGASSRTQERVWLHVWCEPCARAVRLFLGNRADAAEGLEEATGRRCGGEEAGEEEVDEEGQAVG